MGEYTIIFFTSDGYSDCWDPFFVLFKKYWPNCTTKIVVTSEFKDYSFEGLNIISAKVSQKHNVPIDSQPDWGQRMQWALDTIDTDLVMVLQEDFFLKAPVNEMAINFIVDYMKQHKKVGCFHFAPVNAKVSQTAIIPNVYEVKRNTRYRVSAQPAIWRIDELRELIDVNYSPWQFEVFGSKVSSMKNSLYLMYDNSYLNEFPIYPYIINGVIKGKWNKTVIDIFNENGIEVDYSKRGFYNGNSFVNRLITSFKWRYTLYKRTFFQNIKKNKIN